MRRFLAVVFVIVIIALAGCGAGDSAPPPTTPIEATAPTLHSATATINTVGNPEAGCNDDEAAGGEKGDCYLPLFRVLSQGNTARLVLTKEPGAGCPIDREGVSDDQSNCWPQPVVDGQSTKLTVVCQTERDGRGWYGVAVARKQFSNPNESALAVPVPGDNNLVIGFNWENFFVLDDPTVKLAPCPI
ncbi:MAG TPA: hypothetical protein VFZ58_01525 [Candidatus Saccharimonadales bacterium]